VLHEGEIILFRKIEFSVVVFCLVRAVLVFGSSLVINSTANTWRPVRNEAELKNIMLGIPLGVGSVFSE
jgi:hypothetical protein